MLLFDGLLDDDDDELFAFKLIVENDCVGNRLFSADAGVALTGIWTEAVEGYKLELRLVDGVNWLLDDFLAVPFRTFWSSASFAALACKQNEQN